MHRRESRFTPRSFEGELQIIETSGKRCRRFLTVYCYTDSLLRKRFLCVFPSPWEVGVRHSPCGVSSHPRACGVLAVSRQVFCTGNFTCVSDCCTGGAFFCRTFPAETSLGRLSLVGPSLCVVGAPLRARPPRRSRPSRPGKPLPRGGRDARHGHGGAGGQGTTRIVAGKSGSWWAGLAWIVAGRPGSSRVNL